VFEIKNLDTTQVEGLSGRKYSSNVIRRTETEFGRPWKS